MKPSKISPVKAVNEVPVSPSPWAPIEPIVPKQLRLHGDGKKTLHPEDIEYLADEYYKQPLHTSRDWKSIRSRIVWRARRGGDMAMVEGQRSCESLTLYLTTTFRFRSSGHIRSRGSYSPERVLLSVRYELEQASPAGSRATETPNGC